VPATYLFKMDEKMSKENVKQMFGKMEKVAGSTQSYGCAGQLSIDGTC